MMVQVGSDIVSVERIEKAIQKYPERFLSRFLTHNELLLEKSVQSYAGIWAAKEAIAKALGCGIGKELSFHDIEVKKDAKGRPYFELSKRIKESFGLLQSSLSISHEKEFAIAVAVVVCKNQSDNTLY